MASEPIVDPAALAEVLRNSGVAKRTVAKVVAGNKRQKPVVGQGAAEPPAIRRL